MISLTARQKQVYAIVLENSSGGVCHLTVREMAKALGISSPNGVMCHLKSLAKKGFISMPDGRARSIRLLTHEKQIRLRLNVSAVRMEAGYGLWSTVARPLEPVAVTTDGETGRLIEPSVEQISALLVRDELRKSKEDAGDVGAITSNE